MLSSSQQREFAQHGLVRLPGAIERRDVTAMCDHLWRELADLYQIDRGAPETWTALRPSGFQSLVRSDAFAPMASPAVRAALDDLLGSGCWQAPTHWGLPLVTFPRTGRWEIPSGEWHLDFPATADEALGVARIFAFVSTVPPQGGGTLALAGSHRLIRRLAVRIRPGGVLRSADARKHLIRTDPWLASLWSADVDDREQRFMTDGATIDGIELRVSELTGEPGDVVLMHPWILHAAAPNCRTQPRLMLTQSVFQMSRSEQAVAS